MSKRTVGPVAVISSTAREMPAYLREALDVSLRLGIVPVMVEQPFPDDRDAVETALSLVDEADVYIGVFGHRYGYIPPGYNKSLSEMEYDRALECGIPRLVFLTSQDRLRETVEVDRTEETKLERFIARVEEKQFVSRIRSTAEFRAFLSESLTPTAMRRKARPASSQPMTVGAGDSKKGGSDAQAKSARPKAKSAKKQRRVLRLFVASPRDVQNERSRMPKVVESLNRTLGKLLNVVIELWRWEVDAPPAIGEPQALVDPELDKADVVVVIFWNRFGTPTSAGTTGTESEVLRSLARWSKVRLPQVMIYFCQRPARLERIELEQRLKLLDFRERISSFVLAVDYEEAQEFEWRVRDDLFITISSLVVRPRTRRPSRVTKTGR